MISINLKSIERIQKMNIFELIDFLKVETEKIITSVNLDINL